MADETAIVKLSSYLVASGRISLAPFDLSVVSADFWTLEADMPEKALLLFQALATLLAPLQGSYRMFGQPLNFQNYQNLLECKRKIAYISPTISLVSNRTLRENLLLTDFYERNRLFVELTPDLERLCAQFDLLEKLDQRAAETGQWELRTGLAIREMAKDSALLLVDRPEEIFTPDKRLLFIRMLMEKAAAGKPIVFYSRNKKYIDNFTPSGKIEIEKRNVTIKHRLR